MGCLLLGSVLVTSFISGVFGMAGGMLLMGILTLTLPTAAAMVLHGIIQLGSNGLRAYLLKDNIKYRVLAIYILGSFVGFGIFWLFKFVPAKSFILIAIGLSPFLASVVAKAVLLDIEQTKCSFAAGFAVTTAQILAGTSGPILDTLFIKSSLNRHQIIATKAITQVFGHFAKLAYYAPLYFGDSSDGPTISSLLLSGTLACGFLGTKAGTMVLDRLSDLQFQKYSRLIVMLIGGFYFIKGLSLIV